MFSFFTHTFYIFICFSNLNSHFIRIYRCAFPHCVRIFNLFALHFMEKLFFRSIAHNVGDSLFSLHPFLYAHTWISVYLHCYLFILIPSVLYKTWSIRFALSIIDVWLAEVSRIHISYMDVWLCYLYIRIWLGSFFVYDSCLTFFLGFISWGEMFIAECC